MKFNRILPAEYKGDSIVTNNNKVSSGTFLLTAQHPYHRESGKASSQDVYLETRMHVKVLEIPEWWPSENKKNHQGCYWGDLRGF